VRWHPWKGLGDLPREIWILFAATVVNRVGTMVLPFLTIYLTRQMGLEPARAGLVVALYGAGALIASPVAGLLCDRFGSLRLMKVSLLLSASVMLGTLSARSFSALAVWIFVLALTTEMYRPANLAATSRLVSPEHHKAAFALNRLAINLGMSVGPALGGFLAELSFRMLFLVDAFTTILAGLVLTFCRFSVDSPVSRPPTEHGPPWRKALSDRSLVFFLLAMTPVTLVFFQDMTAMPLYFVQDLRLPAAAYGLSFTINTLMIVFLEVPLNLATVRWSHRFTLALGSLLVSLGFGMFGLVHGLAGAMGAVVVWTLGEMILLPGQTAYVAHIAPPGRQGQYMGMFSMAFALGFVIGPWLGMELYQLWGGRMLWGIALGCGIVSVILCSRVFESSVPEPS
jgi:MFS family permease